MKTLNSNRVNKMTVIAWDGKTLAADRQCTDGNIVSECTKIFKVDGAAIAFCGRDSAIIELLDWYTSGCNPEEWPKFQKPDNFTTMIVALDGKCFEYEERHTSRPIEGNFMAWGSGRNFAVAAMDLGKSASEAVAVASKHCCYSGMGIDAFDVGCIK